MGRFDARHEKTDLKVFVAVIPKEGWARGHAYPSFGMTPTFTEYEVKRLKFIKSASYQKKDLV